MEYVKITQHDMNGPIIIKQVDAIKIGDAIFQLIPEIGMVRLGYSACPPVEIRFTDYVDIPENALVEYALHLLTEDAKEKFIQDIKSLTVDAAAGECNYDVYLAKAGANQMARLAKLEEKLQILQKLYLDFKKGSV